MPTSKIGPHNPHVPTSSNTRTLARGSLQTLLQHCLDRVLSRIRFSLLTRAFFYGGKPEDQLALTGKPQGKNHHFVGALQKSPALVILVVATLFGWLSHKENRHFVGPLQRSLALIILVVTLFGWLSQEKTALWRKNNGGASTGLWGAVLFHFHQTLTRSRRPAAALPWAADPAP